MTDLNNVKNGVADKTYHYDPDLPYVVVRDGIDLVAKFAEQDAADHFASQRFHHKVIDTTPAPRVPEDARFITWKVAYGSGSDRAYAERDGDQWFSDEGDRLRLEHLPGVTPDTVFTVLEERKQ